MKKRPVIGITGPNRGGFIAWLMTAFAILRCGGKPVRITPSRHIDESVLNGLVIGGGTDVDPFQYGEKRPKINEESQSGEKKSSVQDWLVNLILTLLRAIFATHSKHNYDLDRDEMEKHLIQHALYFSVPILGICRGAQLMNVALGGTLHQNIEHFYTEETNNIRSLLPCKPVTITADSKLQRILQTEYCYVNALHNQSINKLGDDIMVSAVEPTGVIQAIERRGDQFFLGVQWHPEYIPQNSNQVNIFQSLIHHSADADNQRNPDPG